MKINMGNNIIRFIKSYEDIVKMKLNPNFKVISPEQYLSMLFNNLGYSYRPDSTDELKCLVPINNVFMSQPLIFPQVPHDDLVFPQNRSTLFQLITAISNWIISDIERGHILDLSKSFKIPNQEELQFNITNNINMQRTGTIKTSIDYWFKNDIYIRRQYNISPKIDKEYFSKCIIDFYKVSKIVELYFPCIAFISCIVNPDIFFNVIRTSEKQAFDYVYNTIKDPYEILITDDQLIDPFKYFLNKNMLYLNTIYQQKSVSGFTVNTLANSSMVNVQLPVDAQNYLTIGNSIQLTKDTINNINTQIFNTELDGDHKSYILQYVESNSLDILNSMGEDSIVRKNSYKKLYYTIMQIKQYNPELLNRKEKFIFSTPFYVNQEIFALYHKQRNTFFITFPDLVLREMSPNQAIEFYKKYLGKNVKLDFKEMIDSYDSPAVPYIDIQAIAENKIQDKPITQEPIQQQAQQAPSTQQPEQQTQATQSTKQGDYIGYDISEVVV